VKPRTKFLIGGLLVLGSATYLMASSIGETGMYYLTPNELHAKVSKDPSFYGTGIKVGGRVVTGTIEREAGGRSLRFVMVDSRGQHRYPVVYRGIAPDTFTDNVDVVVEGRLGEDGVFQATTLLAKCASRYEEVPTKPGEGHPPGAGGYGGSGGSGGYAAPAAGTPATGTPGATP
jgi:cytochrome c-type biogenesis protein CcmE